MNFNIDDPLADLLSDNSLTNDNFFEQNNEGSRNYGSKNSSKLLATGKSNRLEDLFGIKEEKEELEEPGTKKSSVSSFSVGNRNTPLAASTPRKRNDKSNTTQDGYESVDDDLGFDPKAPKATSTNSTNFDDWFSKLDTPKRPATAPGNSAAGIAAIPKRSDQNKLVISRQSTDTTTENSNLLHPQARPKTAGGRRSSAQSSTTQNQEPILMFDIPPANKKLSTADWLGLSSTDTKEIQPSKAILADQEQRMQEPEAHEIDNESPQIEIPRLPGNDDIALPEESIQLPTSSKDPNAYSTFAGNDTTLQNIMILGNRNVESNNAFQALQQQQNQLALVTQMKVQERALAELQRKQEEALKHQEQQFQSLLQNQIMRQQQMEDHIRSQQQRISSHLKLLMTQPAIFPISQYTTGENDDLAVRNSAVENSVKAHSSAAENAHQDLIDLEIKRLEMEKVRLEDTLENMRSNYEKEIEMLHASYKAQIEVVEEHRKAIEERLKDEIESSKDYYGQKLQDLENEYNKYKSDMEANLESLHGDHEDQLRKLRKSHEEDLDMLKEEHRRMLERLRQTKMLEFATVQGGGSYLETLKAASSNLSNISGDLQDIRDEMYNKITQLQEEKERNLELRERKIADSERRLEINEKATESEKKRLMDLVSTLEIQLNELTRERAEENWQLRSKISALEAEKLAFEKEKEYAREQLRRDEKRLEDLKELQNSEHQRKILELQEERQAIMVEHKKLEAERKIHENSDFETHRLEVEAQFGVAQKAIRQADAERDRYLKLQRQLDQQQRSLLEKHTELSAKESELAAALSNSRVNDSRTQSALKKARHMEQQFVAKIQLLQKRVRQLNEREAQLSQERFLLTQERIALHNLKSSLSERNCALCRLTSENVDINEAVRTAHLQNSSSFSNAKALMETKYSTSNTDLVDRMLDENVEESLMRMKGNAALDIEFWSESGLDDDTKKIALSNFVETNSATMILAGEEEEEDLGR